ncbi:MAG: prolyl-tRNA synthetase associated domain-containing protein [Pikeienuella sp.]
MTTSTNAHFSNQPPAIERELCAFLESAEVSYDLHRHAPLFTVEDSKDKRGDMIGVHSKNLFLKEKKGGYVLVVCEEDRAIRIKHLEKAIGAKRLSFGSAELLGSVLGVIPGAVSPFALFNDRHEAQVRLILDAQMMAAGDAGALLHFHPMHNEATLAVTSDALRAFFAATGHNPEEIDFDALEVLSAADS